MGNFTVCGVGAQKGGNDVEEEDPWRFAFVCALKGRIRAKEGARKWNVRTWTRFGR